MLKATAKVKPFFETAKVLTNFLLFLCCNIAKMVEKYTGIVLRTFKYNDSLMVADLFTLQQGRKSFLLPVTHSKKARVRNVLFQPLSMVVFTASGKSSKSLARILEAQPYQLYASIPCDVVKSTIALYLAEALTYALRENGEDESIFLFLDRALTWFDATEEGYADFHLVFLSQLLHFLGIFPNIENLAQNSYFDLQAGCLVREHPLHPHFLLPADAARFVTLLRADFQSVRSMALNREQRGAYLAVLEEYYRLHVPDFPRLRSSEVLREIFAG